MGIAWDVVFIMFNNTHAFFGFSPAAICSSDLVRLSRADRQWIFMFSLYQCWPERKDLDLNSIKVWGLYCLFLHFLMVHMRFDVRHSYFRDWEYLLWWYKPSVMWLGVFLCVFQHSKPWSWYLEYLFSQGYDGLKQFVQSNISLPLTAAGGQGKGPGSGDGDGLST